MAFDVETTCFIAKQENGSRLRQIIVVIIIQTA